MGRSGGAALVPAITPGKSAKQIGRRYAAYLYLLVLLPCFIYTVYYTTRAIGLDYIAVPTWDAWRCVHYLDRLLKFDLSHFWIQHNEHRVIFVDIVYYLDLILLRGRQFLPIGCEIVCEVAQLALLWWLLQRMQGIPKPIRLALGACCGLFMTSALHVQVILIPFLVQWYLSQALAALALLLLWHSAQTGRLASLVTSILAAVVVTYTTGNGMLLWPILVMMAVLLRISWRRIAAIVIAAAASVAVYFVGYVFVGHGRAALVLSHPFYTAWFMAIFLGVPASYFNNLFGGSIGLIGMLLSILALVVAIRQRRSPDAVFTVAGGFCLFIVCSALMVAYGRINPSDPTFLKARADRYAVVPLTFWANLVVVAGWLAMQLPRGRRFVWHLAAASLTVYIVLALMGKQESCERAFATRQALGEEAGMALVNGMEDRDVLRPIYQDPIRVLADTPVLRRRRLSIFAAGRQDWIGQPVSQLFQVGLPDPCFGNVDELAVIDGGYRAEGWAWDPQADRPPADIVFASPSGTIVGVGETRTGGYPHDPTDRNRRPPSDLDWAGFVRADRVSGSLLVYAIVGGGKVACALGAPRQVPHARPVETSRVGAPIHISEWKADPAWTVNGFHPSVGTLAGEILYGSYSGSDANQGTLTSAPFETGGQGCVALPVAHGPSTVGQSVRLIEAGSGKTVAAIPLGKTDGIWQYWSVDVSGTPKLRIIAEDQGNQWGQWVAVGEPHWCRP